MKSVPLDPWSAEYIYRFPGKKRANDFGIIDRVKAAEQAGIAERGLRLCMIDLRRNPSDGLAIPPSQPVLRFAVLEERRRFRIEKRPGFHVERSGISRHPPVKALGQTDERVKVCIGLDRLNRQCHEKLRSNGTIGRVNAAPAIERARQGARMIDMRRDINQFAASFSGADLIEAVFRRSSG